MAQLSMNKVIHAAVRRDLGRFEDALASLGPGDTARAADLARAWENFRFQLDHHHHAEHEVVWPALTAYGVDPALLAEMDSEHGLMAAALTEADAAVRGLVDDAGATARDRALASVRHLRAVTEPHLEHEERELEPVIQGDFAHSPEAKEMEAGLRAGGLVRAGVMMSWLADGAGPAETDTLRRLLPAPLRVLLLGVLGRGYRRDVASVWR
ncbi:hemerythrin domain-containing protein [Nocardioides aurantiacus]|uniref:hemerythrin domain-containing protein n=1 Tax=Nocardioides aurantiacus TaxID=86796 RepID=UPI00403F4AA7